MEKLIDEYEWHVLDATADDWESLDQIVPHLERFLGPVDRAGIVRLIIKLVDDGMLKEMRYKAYRNLTAEMILETPMEFWFCMTTEGKELWDSEGYKYR